jgi:hypothetical protein
MWSLPWLVGIWWFDRSVAFVAICAVVFCYMSVTEVVLDRWRLRRPSAPTEAERRLRLFTLLPVIVGIPLAIFLFT